MTPIINHNFTGTQIIHGDRFNVLHTLPDDLFGGIGAATIGAVGYYFKVYKSKQQDPDEGDFDDENEPENEEREEDDD